MEGGIRNSFSLHQHFGENEAGVECLGTLERKRDVRGVNFEFSHFIFRCSKQFLFCFFTSISSG